MQQPIVGKQHRLHCQPRIITHAQHKGARLTRRYFQFKSRQAQRRFPLLEWPGGSRYAQLPLITVLAKKTHIPGPGGTGKQPQAAGPVGPVGQVEPQPHGRTAVARAQMTGCPRLQFMRRQRQEIIQRIAALRILMNLQPGLQEDAVIPTGIQLQGTGTQPPGQENHQNHNPQRSREYPHCEDVSGNDARHW